MPEDVAMAKKRKMPVARKQAYKGELGNLDNFLNDQGNF